MNKGFIVLVLLLILSISVIPINLTRAEGVPNPDTFTQANRYNAVNCDPAFAYDTDSGELISNVYESLLTFDGPAVDRFVPMLAESWSGSENPGRNIIPSPHDPAAPPYTVETWYFKIRNDVLWQNPAYGVVTPQDVEYSFERSMVMDPYGPQWMLYQPLLSAFSSWDWGDLSNLTIAAQVGHMIDDAIQSNATHVWFNLRQGYAAFQQILCQSLGSIMCKAWAVADTGNWPGWSVSGYTGWVAYNKPLDPGPLMDPPVMMGTGPYKLDYWDTNYDTGGYRLVKFDNYWGGWSSYPHVSTVITKVVSDWATRKAMFLSNDSSVQVDACYVPRLNYSDFLGAAGVRFMYDLPTLRAGGFFFNYDVDPSSSRIPTLAGAPKRDLFSDRHMRLAFSYAFNVTDFIQSYYLGEAFPIGNPVIRGIAYYNASKPYHNLNIAKVTSELTLAWGNALTQGFTVEINFNTGNTARQLIATMIADIINGITGTTSCTVVGIPWGTYLSEMYNYRLCAWVLDWLTDFPDPHNWVMPFMHTDGDFSEFQNINYGQDPSSMDWVNYNYGGGFPYTNYNGDTVTHIDNDYVDGLIELGIQIPDSNPLRGKIYTELMDIFYAECPALMTFQPLGRHYERNWLQGWYYNPARPGCYVYDLCKEDKALINYDMSVWGAKKVWPYTGQTVIAIGIWCSPVLPSVPLLLTVKLYKNWKSGDPQPMGQLFDVVVSGSKPFYMEFPPSPLGTVVGYYAWITPMYHWIDCYTMLPCRAMGIDSFCASHSAVVGPGLPPSCHNGCIGDLGGFKTNLPPPYFFAYDGVVDTKDLALWLMAFKYNGPF